MSIFHSVISRRDFMKGIGAVGAGIGTANSISPIFHDLDELSSSTESANKLPWYIKAREYDNPTVDIDWQLMQRFDQRNQFAPSPAWNKVMYDLNIEGIKNKTPGSTLKDQAFMTTYNLSRPNGAWSIPEPVYSYAGGTRTQLGLAKWEGTPEDNLRTCASAVHFFGGREISVMQISENSKKNFYSYDTKGLKYVFEDIDDPYSNSTTALAIPNKCRYVLVWSTPQTGITKFNYCTLSKASVYMAYSDGQLIRNRVQYFIRGLGYQALSGPSPAADFGTNTGFGALSGCGELGRTDYLITPKFGARMRYSNFIVTDMPLAPTPPIDAGIWRFCQTCKKCADTCPSGALSTSNEPTYDVSGHWNGAGRKCYPVDYSKCWRKTNDVGVKEAGPGGCNNCQVACVFSKDQGAVIHNLIKTTVASTSTFNSFFRSMDDAFNYGDSFITPLGQINVSPEEWWSRDLDSYPYKGSITGV